MTVVKETESSLTGKSTVMIVTGEVSGDMHAAKLVKALKQRNPALTFFGTGGPELRREGVETVQDIREMAVMGFAEVARHYFFFRKLFHRLIRIASERKPDAVILVDYPGFNLRLADRLSRMGIRVVYYICPQVWAWNRSRIPKMARIINRLITIFPFEEKHFADSGLKVDFVGHPLVAETDKTLSSPPAALPWKSSDRIALLPGSRMNEINRLLHPMIDSAAVILRSKPSASFIIAAASEEMAEHIRAQIKSRPSTPDIPVVAGMTREIIRQARAAVVASGTATVETALLKCPMVIVYKVAWLTYLLGRMLIRIRHIGMVNIIAERTICPELIQMAATPAAIADAILPLITDTPQRRQMISELEAVRHALGSGDVEKLAADAVIQELEFHLKKPGYSG